LQVLVSAFVLSRLAQGALGAVASGYLAKVGADAARHQKGRIDPRDVAAERLLARAQLRALEQGCELALPVWRSEVDAPLREIAELFLALKRLCDGRLNARQCLRLKVLAALLVGNEVALDSLDRGSLSSLATNEADSSGALSRVNRSTLPLGESSVWPATTWSGASNPSLLENMRRSASEMSGCMAARCDE
jgi:hypothetical protein